MARRDWLGAALGFMLTLSGCAGGDGGGHGPAPFVADILSDTRVDGDIDSGGTVTVGAGEVLAGVDPTNGIEYRGFLSFPLASIPGNADVRYASLDIFVVELDPPRSTPFDLDLVAFTPPLVPSDYSDGGLPFLATRNFTVFASDRGHFVRIDVTSLVREAFFRRLADGQFRLLLDVNENVGLMVIDDPLRTTATAPLLHIEYY